jgi:hypothetical protein
LLIDRGDEQSLEKDELLQWVTWSFADGVVAGALATLLVIGWVDIISMVVDVAGTLVATATIFPIPSELLLGALAVVVHVAYTIGPRWI